MKRQRSMRSCANWGRYERDCHHYAGRPHSARRRLSALCRRSHAHQEDAQLEAREEAHAIVDQMHDSLRIREAAREQLEPLDWLLNEPPTHDNPFMYIETPKQTVRSHVRVPTMSLRARRVAVWFSAFTLFLIVLAWAMWP